ncbi:TPA: hypothetical protein N2G40_000389 [Salmonella enterica]|uniref:O-antigen flippase n=1 Tax=Salmonella enterica TaxID=28901 RepID=U3GL73_SALER|nr:O-antigen flippase [Salmonella enterica]HCL5277180.1 hypothetical protein [Salmonella enterica]
MFKNKAALGAQIGLLTSILILISNFFLRSYFVKVYGSDLTGYYLLVVQLMGVLNLAELGVSTALTYILFKPLHNKNEYELKELYFIIKKIYNIIALVILCVGVFFFFFLHLIVNANISFENLYITWGVFVVSTSLSYLYSSQSILLTADQNIYLVKSVTGLMRTLTYILQIYLMTYGVSFWIVCAIELLSNVLQLFIFNKITLSKYPYIAVSNTNNFIDNEGIKHVKVKIRKEIKYTFVHKFAGVIVFNTDYLIISIFLGVSVITSFSSYMMLIQALGFIISAIASPLGAHIGAKLYTDSKEKLINLLSLYNSIFFMLGILCAYMFYISSSAFVSIWMGKTVSLDQSSVLLLSVNCFVLIARTSFDAAKVGLGYMSDIQLPLLEASINIILSLILVHYLGLNGIIFGTLISNVLVVMFLKPIFLYKNALQLHHSFIFFELIKNWFFALIFLLLMFTTVGKVILISNSWLSFIGQIFVNSVIPMLLLMIVYSIFDSNIRGVIMMGIRKLSGIKKMH